MNLPPGFHFSPTDEELILHYLAPMASNLPCLPNIIPHLHLSLFHPSQFNGKALSSGDQFYFFTSCKSNRVTKSGYWKEMGVTEPIVSISSGKCVGLKKYLEFIINDDDKDSQVQNNNTETSWVMQEYHLCSYNEFNNTTSDKSSTTRGTRKLPKNKGEKQSKWVLCRVYERNMNSEEDDDDDDDGSLELSWADQVFMSLDDDDDEISFPN